jgi:hypothetical protein
MGVQGGNGKLATRVMRTGSQRAVADRMTLGIDGS